MSSQTSQFNNLNSISHPLEQQQPPPSYSTFASISTSPSTKPADESSPLCEQGTGQGEMLPEEPPPPYTNGGPGALSTYTSSPSSIRTQPEGYQKQSHTSSQNSYAPSQDGCCELIDAGCTGCIYALVICQCCLELTR
ncbi:uncharacterized protein LOC143300874 [Babylonia areolata]|uniref:uncharacterized protein LOC143300874 n=1 Tax=Babylonia areolata TaxID=304850 RepID=UPI003FD181D0